MTRLLGRVNFADRRSRLLQALRAEGRGALLLSAAPELVAGADGELRYQPDPDFYYLTGCTEPDAVLLLVPDSTASFTMFVRPRDPERELWSGPRLGEAGAVEQLGADAAHPLHDLPRLLPGLLDGVDRLHLPLHFIAGNAPGSHAVGSAQALLSAALADVLGSARRARPRTGRGVYVLSDAASLMAPMRLRKDADEIAALREAARITCEAYHDTASALRDAAALALRGDEALALRRGAVGEWELEAALEYGFRRRGGSGPSFPSIVAGGANATILHYRANDQPLPRTGLVLLDAGARHAMYCADVTRTWPVAGAFNDPQRLLYDVVLRAHDAAISVLRPGTPADAMDAAAVAMLTEGLVELGLLRGSVEDLIEQRAYRRYFPHRTSHWLGLDVHDVGDYAGADGSAIPLEAGMVLTIEPGLYIRADDTDAPPEFRGIGIRLEDDALITDDGSDVLTAALPIRADDVETMLRN